MQLQLAAEPLGRRAYKGQIEVPADAEGEIGERAEVATGQGFGFIRTILALDCPEGTVPRLGDEVYTFVERCGALDASERQTARQPGAKRPTVSLRTSAQS